MHRLALSLSLTIIISATLGANIPQEKPRNSGKSIITPFKPQSIKNPNQTNPGTSSQRKGDRGQLITTKFDSTGNPQEQCRCTAFHLCNVDKVYQSPNGEKLPCDSGMVCCIEQYTYSTETEPLFPGRGTGSTPMSVAQNTDCVCVAEDQCSQLGAGIIQSNYKGTGICGNSQVCCPTLETSSQVIPGVTPTSENQLTPQCSCVSPSRCNSKPLNDTNTTPDYGAGVILYKSPPCDLNDICSSCVPSEICCLTSDVTTNPWNVSPPVTGSGNLIPSTTSNFACGLRSGDQSIASKITNPEDSSFGEFPWMTLILERDESNHETVVCGASLLSVRVVLTAAHCVNNKNPDSLIIRVGEYNTQSDSEPLPHQDRRISEINVHPLFKVSVAHYDLALIAVREPFQLAQNVAPICAPFANTTFGNPNVYDWTQCIATGWGKNAYSVNANYQNTLKKIDLRIVDREQCQSELRKTALQNTFILDKSFVCAKGSAGDTCKGDGGGPLICAIIGEPNRYVQVGITSWGIGCGNELPAAYASLYHSAEWLTSQYLIYNDFSL